MMMIQFQRRRIEKELNNFQYIIDGNQLFFIYKNRPIRVHISESYPFIPPKVYVEDKLVQYTRSDYPINQWKAYEKQYHNISSSTILYKENWTPVLGIISIIDEYFQFQNEMEKIRTQLILENHTTLPSDIIHEIVKFL